MEDARALGEEELLVRQGVWCMELLGMPSQMAFAAMLPLGRPVKQLTKLKREPVDEFAMLERWDGEKLDE